MVTIKFINVNGKGQMTVKDSQKKTLSTVCWQLVTVF